MTAPNVPALRTSLRQDLLDATLTVAVAIATALFIRTRVEPLSSPAAWPLLLVSFMALLRNTPLRRASVVIGMGLLAGMLVSNSYFRY